MIKKIRRSLQPLDSAMIPVNSNVDFDQLNTELQCLKA